MPERITIHGYREEGNIVLESLEEIGKNEKSKISKEELKICLGIENVYPSLKKGQAKEIFKFENLTQRLYLFHFNN